MSVLKTRFAPSPTGLLHLGNARTALFSAFAGDRFLLRIEDTDSERSRSVFVDGLIEDLHWLGLDWGDGPQSSVPTEGFFQSRRSEIYRAYYERLEAEEMAYPCFCTQAELEIARKVQLSAGKPPRYSGKCAALTREQVQQRLAQGLKPALRFRVSSGDEVEFEDGVRGPQHFRGEDIGDFIIRRADGTPAFFFCNAVDDALMGVDCVIRGEDHLSNTPRQLLILRALDLPLPAYAHISLITGDDGAPLSKRNGSVSLKELRERGYFPLAVANMLARLGQYYESDPGLMSFADLRAGFVIGHLGKSPSRFDPHHLDHWQEESVRAAGHESLWQWLFGETRSIVPDANRAQFLDVVRSNCMFPSDADQWARVFFTDEWERPDAEAGTELAAAGEAFFLAALDALSAADHTDFSGFLDRVKQRTGLKGKSLFVPLRLALTGRHDGPELAKIFRLLGRERMTERFARYADMAC
ncbi:glutamate--tRNA ligase [Candidatus Methylospira mobilis]|uniref:Glutamate--tRNA ligase n=1 Tax=Candidatus Methylospira mobilis TaxID=1808979 RepID=A0A5Q0BEY6_9GAMM|nr:glutamate--tRNA ligase [Candidatus Methylospira mobilis]QFY42390.1 glutamate--tRNA ligase [Candidatus Methylospira mobilis]WNV04509.1 glutamate--tRNA ligase [Candidatus Methylospira mobilis]